MSLIPVELRANPVEVAGRTMRELALPGRVTVGLTGYGRIDGGGISVVGQGRQMAAVGVTRLERRGDRIWGVPCRGRGPVPVGLSMSFSVHTGFMPNGPVGTYRSGSFAAPVSGKVNFMGDVDNYLQVDGVTALSYGSGADVRSYSKRVVAGQVIRWAAVNTGGFAGGSFTVWFDEDMVWSVGSDQPPRKHSYVFPLRKGETIIFTNPFPESHRVRVTGLLPSGGAVGWVSQASDSRARGVAVADKVYLGAYETTEFFRVSESYNVPLAKLLTRANQPVGDADRVDEEWDVPRGGRFFIESGSASSLMSARFLDVVAGPILQAPLSAAKAGAIQALEWAAAGSGVPWRLVEASARAGSWVRRNGWVEYTRRIRFVAGAGTTRAVAVDEAGEVLTPSGFGAAEWLAGDWMVWDDEEPAPVDVSDWVFSGGAQTIAFAVAAAAVTSGESSGGGSPEGLGGEGSPLASLGEGFVYRQDGVDILVPAQDINGDSWRP